MHRENYKELDLKCSEDWNISGFRENLSIAMAEARVFFISKAQQQVS